MANKITKRDIINAMLEEEVVLSNEVYKNYLTHELELLDKKSANKKATKTQEENEVLKGRILEVLTEKGATVSDIQSKDEVLSTLSNQRVSALLRQLVLNGEVVKSVDKKKSYFAKA